MRRRSRRRRRRRKRKGVTCDTFRLHFLRSGALVELIWAVLGLSWVTVWQSWESLGFGRLRGHLGLSWGSPGPSRGPLGVWGGVSWGHRFFYKAPRAPECRPIVFTRDRGLWSATPHYLSKKGWWRCVHLGAMTPLDDLQKGYQAALDILPRLNVSGGTVADRRQTVSVPRHVRCARRDVL